MLRHSPPKVLIVDDNNDLREMLAVLLTLWGYQVVVAVDGEDAVSVAQREEPDLILMDMMMPKLEGLTAAQRIAQQPRLRQVPIIKLSAFRNPWPEDAPPASFSWYACLDKPVEVDKLEQVIRQALQRSAFTL